MIPPEDVAEKIAELYCDSAGCEVLKHHQDCNLSRAIAGALRAYGDERAREAYEEAAKAVEDEISGHILHAEGLPDYIRALAARKP